MLAAKRMGRETRLRTKPEALASARDHLARVAEGWDDALRRLKAHVETS